MKPTRNTLTTELPNEQSTLLDPVAATFICRDIYSHEANRHERILIDLLCHVLLQATIFEGSFSSWKRFVNKVNAEEILKYKVRRDRHRGRVVTVVCQVVFRSINSYDRAYKMARIAEFYRVIDRTELNLREDIEANGGIEKTYKHVCRILPYKGKTLEEKFQARARLAAEVMPPYPVMPSQEDDDLVVAKLEEQRTTSNDEPPPTAAPSSRALKGTLPQELSSPGTVALQVTMTLGELMTFKKMSANEDISLVIRNAGTLPNGWVKFDLVTF